MGFCLESGETTVAYYILDGLSLGRVYFFYALVVLADVGLDAFTNRFGRPSREHTRLMPS